MVTCPTDIPVSRIPYGKRPGKPPQVRLGPRKWPRLLAGVRNPVITMLLRTIYACGLRLGEALALEPRHIDSRQMALAVWSARGRRSACCRCHRCCSANCVPVGGRSEPTRWLFPGKSKERKLCASRHRLQLALPEDLQGAGATPPQSTPHSCCVTAMLTRLLEAEPRAAHDPGVVGALPHRHDGDLHARDAGDDEGRVVSPWRHVAVRLHVPAVFTAAAPKSKLTFHRTDRARSRCGVS